MVRKNPAGDLKMKIYNESVKGKNILEKYIYIGKKRKGQPCHIN